MNQNTIGRISLLEALRDIVDDPEFATIASEIYTDEGVRRDGYGVGLILAELDKLNAGQDYREVQRAIPQDAIDACTVALQKLQRCQPTVWDAIEYWLSQAPTHEQGEALSMLRYDMVTLENAISSLKRMTRGFTYRNHVNPEKEPVHE